LFGLSSGIIQPRFDYTDFSGHHINAECIGFGVQDVSNWLSCGVNKILTGFCIRLGSIWFILLNLLAVG